MMSKIDFNIWHLFWVLTLYMFFDFEIGDIVSNITRLIYDNYFTKAACICQIIIFMATK